MLLTVNKLNQVLSGMVGNEKYSIEYSSDLYQKLIDLENRFSGASTIEEVKEIIAEAKDIISNKDEEIKMKGIGEYLVHNEKNDKYYLKSGDVISSVPIPKVLIERIIEAKEKEIDYMPMIKAWMWFLKNKNFSLDKAKRFAKYITTTYVDRELVNSLVEEGYTYEKAVEMATFNDVAITKNGLIHTYKYVTVKFNKFNTEDGTQIDRYASSYDEETGKQTIMLPDNAEDYFLIPPVMRESGDAFYAGSELGHRVVVGNIHRLDDWSKVNCDDHVSCVKGLHLGGRQYIQGYGGRTEYLLNCFVNPMDIGAFTDDGSGAMRVLSFFVHSAAFAENKSFYNESEYLAYSSTEWDNIRSESIKQSEEKIAKLKNLQKELNAL